MERYYCIYCHYGRVKRGSDQRFYCRKCKRRFSLKKRKRDLEIIKYFTLEIPANKTAKFLHINYRTVAKVYQRLREFIYKASSDEFRKLSGEIEVDDTYFGGRRKGEKGRASKNKVIVLGMLERKGKVFTTVLEGMSTIGIAKTIMKSAEKGSIFYTDKYKSYKSLYLISRHLTVDHAEHFTHGRAHINGLEGFWSFAKERLLKYHGVSKKYFAYYLKEMEYRYNHRHQDLLNLFTNLYFLSKNT